MHVKNSFATRVNELSVLKLFQLSNGDLLFSKHDYSLYKVRKPGMTKLGWGVGVRAHYPKYLFQIPTKDRKHQSIKIAFLFMYRLFIVHFYFLTLPSNSTIYGNCLNATNYVELNTMLNLQHC